MQPGLTRHARVRMRQRGIRAEQLELLLEYGRERHLHQGCEIVFLDKAARRRMEHADPRAARIPGNAYAILGRNGVVVTVGHRYRRIGRA